MNSTTAKHIRLLYIIAALLSIAILLFAFSGCSSTAPSTPGVAATPVETKQAPPAENKFLKQFGDIITFDNGVTISISEPAPYTPTQYAAGTVDGNENLVFNVVVTNGSDEPIDPMFLGSVSAGGQEASSIIDMENNIGLPPSTAILPGQSVTWQEAYAVVSSTDITFQMSYNFFKDAIFTNVPF